MGEHKLTIEVTQAPDHAPKDNDIFHGILNRLRELIKSERRPDDEWEIPFERIRLSHNDFQRCGSQGDVFYGKISNNPVAVKRVKEKCLANIRHLKDLNHKNIIKFKGVSENSTYHYIIMEWCPYGTLYDHIHSGRALSASILSDFAQQIASGMKYLHSKKIIHRDLKPSNILLTHRDTLKISDFGTHRLLSDTVPETSITYAGTCAYMAPEVIRSEPYSYSVDVWSYGVVLWEILTGDEPYKNLDKSTVVWAVGNNSFRLPIPLTFPEGFTLILNGCWRAQPSTRLTFQQICMILKGAVHEVANISQERWLPLQAGWKRDIKDALNKHLQLTETQSGEDNLSLQKRQALEEALEQAQKRLVKNNNIYLRLQECCMHLQRDRQDLALREQMLAKREEDLAKREEDFARREKSIKCSNTIN